MDVMSPCLLKCKSCNDVWSLSLSCDALDGAQNVNTVRAPGHRDGAGPRESLAHLNKLDDIQREAHHDPHGQCVRVFCVCMQHYWLRSRSVISKHILHTLTGAFQRLKDLKRDLSTATLDHDMPHLSKHT